MAETMKGKLMVGSKRYLLYRQLERYRLTAFGVIFISLMLMGCTCLSPWLDFDGDNIQNKADKCPEYYDPRQSDFDGDGIGDVCDEDADNDTYISALFSSGNDCDDLNPEIYPGKGCPEGGIGFAPPPGQGNMPPSDNDGIRDSKDNCPTVDNQDQMNSDGDKYGDACDTCPNFTNPDQSIPVWYKDVDNDFYSDGTSLTQCSRPAGYKVATELQAVIGDCDDSDGSVNPGVTDEIAGNGKDDDCNPATSDISQAYYIQIARLLRCLDTNCSNGVEVPYQDWEPLDGEIVVVEFKVKSPPNGEVTTTPNSAGEVITDNFSFSLSPVFSGPSNPTAYAGRYTNDSGQIGDDFSHDFTFGGANQIKLTAKDYGGSITVRATVSIATDSTMPVITRVDLEGDFTFPKDTDLDGLPDFWEGKYGDLTPAADPDGDQLTAMEEYRGFMWGKLVLATDPLSWISKDPSIDPSIYDTPAYVPSETPQGEVAHFRTNPKDRRDLFVKFVGFDANYPFAIGEAFHKILVDVHGLGNSLVSSAALSDHNIHVATVTLVAGTYSSQPGHIIKRGKRDWTFVTLGASSYGGDSSYGAACNVYRKTHEYFFSDTPYDDYTTLKPDGDMKKQADWVCNGGTYQAPHWECIGGQGNGQLDAIGKCEDKNDNGVINGGEDKSKNGFLDGDHPIPNNTDLDGDGHVDEWDYWQDLSAFDVNKNSEMELPVVGGGSQIDPMTENALPQSLKCVTTHELGHATGVTLHTSVSTCIMFEESNNLIRDNSFSQQAADLVRIHNN